MILDKLLEKKDLRTYVKARVAELRRNLGDALDDEPREHREFIRQRFYGRIQEVGVDD